MLTLEPITQKNFKAVIALELAEGQKGFVQTNEYSIAQSYVYPEFRPRAICVDGVPVGFLLWCIDTDEDQYWIYRLMIDKVHQHKGYGTAALRLLIDGLMEDPHRSCVYISAFPENTAALAVYRKLGFVDDGRMIHGETVLRYDWKKER